MKTSEELKEIIKNNYTIFVKPGCPFSKASMDLLDKLIELKAIEEYKVLMLFEDYAEEQLSEICADYNVFPQGYSTKVSIPQIFMKKEYIGGSDKFYASRWNLGDEDSGSIELYDENGQEHQYPAPRMVNPTVLGE